MIKLGDAYFDEASIVAISPCRTPAGELTQCYSIRVADGHSYTWCADAAEVQRRLEEVGLIAPEAQAVPLDFTSDEIDLLMDALEQGYYYAAKDSTGQIYAYRDLPKKGTRCWNATTDDGRQTLRLHGEFASLSWDDESPLIIEVALEGVPGC